MQLLENNILGGEGFLVINIILFSLKNDLEVETHLIFKLLDFPLIDRTDDGCGSGDVLSARMIDCILSAGCT